ncbi:extracellular solute-binding protein [Cohnella silvisoli]|uniref:Extracellular solute-binding protein n=1 Tax=Cohnella silvisoli TaxID=2873699 RepID=A0ABV1KMT2_9BACL|nr:extracellular solute-binding protein [Cohnella silvisoli]MCD9020267.1 extracellular solute-binding protein [Cohnella silvisoli]
MKFKRRVSTLVASLLVIAVLAGCSGNNGNASNTPSNSGGNTGASAGNETKPAAGNLNETGMPIVKDKITIQMLTGKPPAATDWNKLMLWTEYEKMTNIHIDWVDQVPFANLAEKRNLVLAGGEYTEAFFTSQMPISDLIKYGAEGVFLPLNDLIDKYAPNLKRIFEQYPAIKKGSVMPDGKIYSFPTIVDPEFPSALTGGKIWINKQWLETLGLSEPQTIDDFYKMLKQFKEGDPNRNGKADEVPLSSYWMPGIEGYLRGSWGLGNRGAHAGNFDLDPATGKVRFIPTDKKYKEMLQFMNKLYTENLIDHNVYAVDYAKYIAEGTKGVYGAMWGVDPATTIKKDSYIGSPALEGPDGDRMYTAIAAPQLWTGGLVLTDRAKNPEALVRWIDHFYGEEGGKMFFMGFKDVTYKETADGKVEYVDEIKNNPEGLNLDQAVSKYLTWPGGGYPGIVRQKFFQGAESSPASIEATDKVKPFFPEEVWPPFSFTSEENDTFTARATDIEAYVTEMTAKFVTGKNPFSEWDKYVKTINDMGLEEYIKIFTQALDRYKNS